VHLRETEGTEARPPSAIGLVASLELYAYIGCVRQVGRCGEFDDDVSVLDAADGTAPRPEYPDAGRADQAR
jgi:hypothetical protein